ncbi:MAG TPA: hypothetical protein VMF60_05085, partial [Acidimicrobiales bacterium]|nr:hypothetical protein [Acidimicrobiales bacterium]
MGLAVTVLVGLAATIVAPTTAGATNGWTARTNIDVSGITGVSCPTTSSCTAVDAVGQVLTYNGTHWSAPTGIDGSTRLVAVSCPTTSFCAAIDDAGNALIYTGTWSTASSMDGSNTLVGLSCASSTFCVAVDQQDNALVYDGTSWSLPVLIDSVNQLTAVSCAS